MRGNRKLGLILLGVVMVVIAVIQAGQKEPVNWRKTYNPKDKIPFGTYVVRQELQHLFPENEDLEEVNRSLYSFFTDSTENRDLGEEFFFVGDYFDPGMAALQKLMDYVSSGNTAFLATTFIPDSLAHRLNLSIAEFESYEVDGDYAYETPVYALTGDTLPVEYDRPHPAFFFDTLDSTSTILGNLVYKDRRFPNFVKVSLGKGNFYIQLDPDVYANYYMLKKENYKLAHNSLQHLKGTHLLWYDGQYNTAVERTPLRVILGHPALRWAWYILLLTLLLYLIFKSRREQGAVPIVEPEKNQSVAFAKTIGSLYYENGSPGDMLKKKIRYFHYTFKREFHLGRLAFEDPEWRRQVSLRLGIPEDEISTFFRQLETYRERGSGAGDLIKIQDLIEDFKQKIKHYE